MRTGFYKPQLSHQEAPQGTPHVLMAVERQCPDLAIPFPWVFLGRRDFRFYL